MNMLYSSSSLRSSSQPQGASRGEHQPTLSSGWTENAKVCQGSGTRGIMCAERINRCAQSAYKEYKLWYSYWFQISSAAKGARSRSATGSAGALRCAAGVEVTAAAARPDRKSRSKSIASMWRRKLKLKANVESR